MSLKDDWTVKSKKGSNWKSLLAVSLPLMLAAFLFGPAEYLIMEKPEGDSGWVKAVGSPMKSFVSMFGDTSNYGNRLFAYWSIMYLIVVMLFLLPYFWTKNPQYIYFAIFLAPLTIVIQDWSANIAGGNLQPTWGGPTDAGFTFGLPNFYWPFIAWSAFGIFILLTQQKRLKRLHTVVAEQL